jgi:hypothetical protein
MRRRLVIAAIVLVLAVNSLVLAGVAWNRAGEPQAELVLTERELAPPYAHWPRKENSGIGLRISRAMQDYDWLDRDKLVELGFDPGSFDQRPRDRWRSVDREVWLVLEYDGAAFEAVLARQRERLDRVRVDWASGKREVREVEVAQQHLNHLAMGSSRLMAIDAGRDRNALHARYPDRQRHAIVRGTVRMHAVQGPGDEVPEARARVVRLLPGQVHVPRRFHSELAVALEQPRVRTEAPPRYHATLRYGRRGEPWLTAIEAMAEDEVRSD